MSIHAIARKDGSRGYEVRWREHGRQRSRAFKLKKDAETWDNEVTRRRQLGPLAVQRLTVRKAPTLGEWITDRWAPEHAATLADATRRDATRERYANVYSVHVAPWLEDNPLNEITVENVRAWQAQRVKAGVSPGTIHTARTLLSSVLRHAAESEVIPANPLSVVRAPKNGHRDAVQPLSPAHRRADPRCDPEPATARDRRGSVRAASQAVLRAARTGNAADPPARRPDRIAARLCRPASGELRALRVGDIREKTVLVQQAANPDGSIKSTKTEHHPAVRLLSALAQDVRAYRLAIGRPSDKRLVLLDDDGKPWDKTAWQMWRVDRWAPACRAAGLDEVPRPYDCRHSFASLLLVEGRQPLYVAQQLGHSLAVLLSTYSHLMAEYAESPAIDAEAEISKARRETRSVLVRWRHHEPHSQPHPLIQKPRDCGAFREVPLPGFEASR